MTREEARERVARGAALLDRERPGWAAVIDTGTLRMEYSCSCVLGQLEGTYTRGAARLWRYRGLVPFIKLRRWSAEEHGFYFPGPLTRYAKHCYQLLQDEWVLAIADRVVTGGEKNVGGGVQEACGSASAV